MRCSTSTSATSQTAISAHTASRARTQHTADQCPLPPCLRAAVVVFLGAAIAAGTPLLVSLLLPLPTLLLLLLPSLLIRYR